MSEEEIVDVLDLIIESIVLVQKRFAQISDSEDFVSTSDGVTLLDAVPMRLQVIGESVKRIQKKDLSFLITPFAKLAFDNRLYLEYY